MKTVATLSAVLGLAGLSAAHMEISQPPPLRSKFNDFTTDVDYSMTSPLSQDGSNFPCKGYHSLLGTDQGKSVTTYTPGQSYQMTITGGTIHAGGSCQISLSFDQGSSWTVIHSYIGDCPAATGDTNYDFTVPNDTPAGDALFAWTWFNNLGNREMYMNCASVTIGSSVQQTKRAPSDPFSSRPDMFVANVGNGCTTTETKDVEFPNPGPDVTRNAGDGETAPPVGSCAAGKKLSVLPDPLSPSSYSVSSSSSSQSPVSSPSPSSPESSDSKTTPTVSAPTSLASPTRRPGGVFITVTTTATTPAPTNGAMTKGEACGAEGEWNCVGGSQFQRCASGVWSELMDVHTGTTCTPGRSSNLLIAREKSPGKNWRA
ncbi:hypothetical protein ACO1O0_006401 [Amphichorda felina]